MVSPYNKSFSFFKYNRKIFAAYFPNTIVDGYAEIFFNDEGYRLLP